MNILLEAPSSESHRLGVRPRDLKPKQNDSKNATVLQDRKTRFLNNNYIKSKYFRPDVEVIKENKKVRKSKLSNKKKSKIQEKTIMVKENLRFKKK